MASPVEGTARGFDRLVFFSDAVVAIASTLLIVPVVESVADDDASVSELLWQNGKLMVFLVSFAVIASSCWGSPRWSVPRSRASGCGRCSCSCSRAAGEADRTPPRRLRLRPSVVRVAQDDPIEMARENWHREGWADAEAGMAVVTSIMRAQQLILGSVEAALKPFDLTFARYEVLMLLFFSRRGELPVGRIGDRLQVHPASVTNAVDRLEVDGLVERRRNPRDGRSVLAAITERGRGVATAASDVLNSGVFESTALRDAEPSLFAPLKRLRRDLGDDV